MEYAEQLPNADTRLRVGSVPKAEPVRADQATALLEVLGVR
jgi:hypothetical protein